VRDVAISASIPSTAARTCGDVTGPVLRTTTSIDCPARAGKLSSSSCCARAESEPRGE
jgi:hypothetical protein